jgi:hypothetical protein
MRIAPMCCGITLAMVVSLSACEKDPQAVGHEFAHAPAAFTHVGAGNLEGLAKEVRQVTSRFNSTTQATRAGYAEASPCVAVPGLGGMGFHWVNNAAVDPVFEPLKPEAVLYAPRKNGQLELVAVEYIVIDVGQPAPTFDGHPFDVGGTPVPVPHWSLHVWAHRENPNGLFTPFNPAVICP